MQLYVLFFGLTFFSSFLPLMDDTSTELLPEVKELLDVKPINDPQMAQNAYVYLMAIDAVDDDYFTVGKRIVEYENKSVRLAIKTNDSAPIDKDRDESIYQYQTLKFDDESYRYPCMDLYDAQCVTSVLKDLARLNKLYQKNNTVLTRYKAIIEKPFYDSYPPDTPYSPIPAFSFVVRASNLQQIAAIKAINEGDVVTGIAILQKEIRFAKRLLASKGGLIDKMIAIRLLLTQYHTLAGLLEHPNLQKHLKDDALLELVAPLTEKEQQALVSAMEGELAMQLVFFKTLDKTIAQDYLKQSFDEKAYAQEWLSNIAYYNKNQTMNEAFRQKQFFMSQAALTLPASQVNFQALKDYDVEQLCDSQEAGLPCVIKINQYYGTNLIGGILLETGRPEYKEYYFRLYDLSSYLALVNAKLLIKQQQINAQEIPAFLERLGDKAKNPYTKEPFTWDAKSATLSTQRFEPVKEYVEERPMTFDVYIEATKSNKP